MRLLLKEGGEAAKPIVERDRRRKTKSIPHRTIDRLKLDVLLSDPLVLDDDVDASGFVHGPEMPVEHRRIRRVDLDHRGHHLVLRGSPRLPDFFDDGRGAERGHPDHKRQTDRVDHRFKHYLPLLRRKA